MNQFHIDFMKTSRKLDGLRFAILLDLAHSQISSVASITTTSTTTGGVEP